MRVIQRQWYGVNRPDIFTIIPVGDVHIGNAACDEKLLRAVVERIAADDRCYWIGLGDYADFINRADPRFNVETLAPWIKLAHLGDLAKAQRDRFLEIMEPIADKCLVLIEGNHERAITRYYERDVYREIVTGIKERAGFDADHKLALGYCGWLILSFRYHEREAKTRKGARRLKVYVHHGFVGGKLAGAKALNLQRWLWSHNADLVVFGHSHNRMVQSEAVEDVAGLRVIHKPRVGCYGGTFLDGAAYAQERGYFPAPTGHVEIWLRPLAKEAHERIRVQSGL